MEHWWGDKTGGEGRGEKQPHSEKVPDLEPFLSPQIFNGMILIVSSA